MVAVMTCADPSPSITALNSGGSARLEQLAEIAKARVAPGNRAGIELRGIAKSFGTTAVLAGIDLTVGESEFVAIVGPSGSGKSTLLKIVAGLEPESAGEVLIGGRSCRGLAPRDRDIAMVFQTYALYPHMTAAANIALPLRMRRLGPWQRLPGLGRLIPGGGPIRAGIEREVASVAGAVGIEQLLNRKPSQLSGGQRQRVALARAIIRRPAAFLMDEPLSSLDAKLRLEMREEIAALHRRTGVAFLYVTHDQAEAMTMADRVAVMVDGRILQVGPPRALYEDPTTLSVARFIGSPPINCIPARIGPGGVVELPGMVLPIGLSASPGGTVTVCARPEELALAAPGQPGMSAAVLGMADHGADFFVRLHLESGVEVTLRRAPAELGAVRSGGAVRLTFRQDRLLFFGPDGRRLRSRGAVA